MISASKNTLSLKNLKILRPKVTKKKFCEFPPRYIPGLALGLHFAFPCLLKPVVLNLFELRAH